MRRTDPKNCSLLFNEKVPDRPDWADGVEDDKSKNIDDKKRVSGELYVHWVRVLHLCTPKLEIKS